MILIIGLGNPGMQYHNSRHNAGFIIIDKIVEKFESPVSNSRFNCEIFRLSFEDYNLMLAKPLTFMNNSGNAVLKILNDYSADIERMIVIHDDLDIEFGFIRFKSQGGTGGHNGLESIVRSINSSDFDRLRFGIGRPPLKKDPADYVLSPFKRSEVKELDFNISLAAEAAMDYVKYGIDYAMNKYNSAPAPE